MGHVAVILTLDQKINKVNSFWTADNQENVLIEATHSLFFLRRALWRENGKIKSSTETVHWVDWHNACGFAPAKVQFITEKKLLAAVTDDKTGNKKCLC